MQLAQLVPSITNVESYAKIVRDKYDTRTLILAARDILEDASEGGTSSDLLLILLSSEFLIFAVEKVCRAFSM